MFYGNPTGESGNDLYGDVSIPQNQNTGWYILQVYDQSCNQWIQMDSAFNVVSCNVDNVLTINNPSSLSSCDGLAITNSTSNYPIVEYNWFDTQGNLISTSNFAFNLCNNFYVLSVTDNQGCTAIDTITVGVPPLNGCTDPIAYNYDPAANVDDGSCLYCDLSNSFIVVQNTTGNCDGLIIANAISSNTPITYLWNNGATTNNLVGLCNGVYAVTITDDVGCTEEITFNVDEPNVALEIDSVLVVDSVDCYGDLNGRALVNMVPFSGAPAYNYLWDNGETTFIANSLSGSLTASLSGNGGWHTVQVLSLIHI